MSTSSRAATAVIFLATLLSGCGTVLTHGQYDSEEPSAAAETIKARPLTLRVLQEFGNPEILGAKAIWVNDSPHFASEILADLKNGVLSPQVTVTPPLGQTAFSDKTSQGARLILDPREQRIATDRFVDVAVHQEVGSTKVGQLVLRFLSLISLGFLPTWEPLHVKITTTVYSREGKTLSAIDTRGQATAWAWTPFVLISGFRTINQLSGLDTGFNDRGAAIAVRRVLKSGALE